MHNVEMHISAVGQGSERNVEDSENYCQIYKRAPHRFAKPCPTPSIEYVDADIDGAIGSLTGSCA